MAITDIRKLNVRSPYFVEVLDEYINGGAPAVAAPEEVSVSGELTCGSEHHFGSFSSIFRLTLDTTDKELGVYSFTIANAVMPVKFRAYTKGDTPPSYTTIGLDSYANPWLAVTGEGATSLSTEAANPNGVSRDFTYTTDAATDAISKEIVIDLYAPIETISNMTLFQKTCQPQIAADAPATVDFVTVITVAVNQVYNIFQNGVAVPASDIAITLNGTSHALPNTIPNSGVRLITHDSTPDYVTSDPSGNLENDNPYGHQVNVIWQRKWSYTSSGGGGATLLPQEITNVHEGINELEVRFAAGVGAGVNIFVANHPVSNHPTIAGQRVIKHLGDLSYSTIKGFQGIHSVGNRDFSSPESIKVRFSGVNKQTPVVVSATYHHEVRANDGDSYDEQTNLVSTNRYQVFTAQ